MAELFLGLPDLRKAIVQGLEALGDAGVELLEMQIDCTESGRRCLGGCRTLWLTRAFSHCEATPNRLPRCLLPGHRQLIAQRAHRNRQRRVGLGACDLFRVLEGSV